MIDQNSYLKNRIDDQIGWYDRKSGENKRWYIRLRILSIIISLSIPILTNFIGKAGDNGAGNDNNSEIAMVIAVAGALVAFLEGLMGLKKYHEMWTAYRSTSEGLKYHRYLFETGATPYDVPNAFQLFVQNAESLMATERAKWITVSSQKDAQLKASDYLPGDTTVGQTDKTKDAISQQSGSADVSGTIPQESSAPDASESKPPASVTDGAENDGSESGGEEGDIKEDEKS